MNVSILLIASVLAVFVASTPLDDYVWKPDSHYSWTDTGVIYEGSNTDGSKGWTGYVLNMTSQQWLTPEDVSRSVWYHFLVIIIPSKVNWQQNGTLYVTGGNNDDYPDPKGEDLILASALAMATGML